jgi:hypothetical protein
MTVTIVSTSEMPYNGFPEAISSSNQIFDLSSATGPSVNGIIPGAVYDVYVTGAYRPSYNTGELIYQAQWVSLVSLPSYYYGNTWYGPSAGAVYSNRVFWDSRNNCYWLFESDNRYHCIRDFNAVQGYQITQGLPPVNMEVW